MTTTCAPSYRPAPTLSFTRPPSGLDAWREHRSTNSICVPSILRVVSSRRFRGSTRSELGETEGRPFGPYHRKADVMIGLGVLLLIAAVLFPKLAVLWGVGVLLVFVGIVLAVLGSIGHAVGGRRHYY